MQRRLTLLLVVVVLIVIGLLPLATMLARSIVVDGRFTVGVYEKLFGEPGRYWTPIGHSLALATLTASCATALGVALGLLLGKTDLPWRRTLSVLLSFPLLIPPYFLAVCWFNLLGSRGLLVRVITVEAGEVLERSLFGLGGCLWVLVSAFLPIVMILTVVYLHAVDPRLEEAGRMIARWPGVLRHITLPIMLPGLLFGGIVVFLLALGEVGVPMFLRYAVYPVETLTHFSAFYDFGAAAASATPLLAITLLVLALERRYLRDRTYRLQPTTPGRRILLVPLGRWRVPTLLVVSLLAGLIVFAPLLALVAASVSPSAYMEAWSKAADSLERSLMWAVVGASLLTILGFFCGYLIRNRALWLWRSVDTLTLLLFTLPGTVIGVGLIALWNRTGTGFIYGSAAIVIVAYVAQYTALTSRITVAALGSVSPSLEEAAQLAGVPWLVRIGYVVLPAALPGVVGAWLIGFIFCLRDFGASMLVYPAGQDTLPVRIFTLMANGAPSLVSAVCVMLLAATMLSLAIVGCLLRAARSHR